MPSMRCHELQLGDHVKVSRGLYEHHGLYIGSGWVVHLTGVALRKGEASVQYATLEAFAGASGVHAIEIVEYASSSALEDVLQRAHGQVGRCGYDLFRSNCEHFARWCKTGELRSAQAETVVAAGGALAASSGATAAAVGTVAASGAVAGLSGAGIMSGLATVGGVVGGGAATAVVLLATAPAAIATVAAHRAFRDDAALPSTERDARRAARQGSLVGAAVGTAGTIAAISASGSVAGLSAAGITSGLAALGGTMATGVAVAVAAPALAAGAVGYVVYRIARALRR